MTLKTKLLLCFLTLSSLIMAVGIIFYTQLNSLITPLTPKSIPQSLERLNADFTQGDFISSLIQQQLRVQYDFEYFIFTQQPSALQEYYLNAALFSTMLKNDTPFYSNIFKSIRKQFQTFLNEQQTILQIQKTNPEAAKKILTSPAYAHLLNQTKEIIEKYSNLLTTNLYEQSAVTVKLALKNSTQLLHESLNTSLIIFLDAIIISLIFALISAKTIAEPINMLRNNIERMRQGNLNVPVNKKLLTMTGEVGDLARSFSELMTDLRTTTVWRDELLNEIERRKKFEESLKKTAKRLQETNRELDQFAYIASHDLRAPLRGIETLVSWIKEDAYHALPEEAKHNFDLIKKRAERLEALIDSILEYSRAGRVPEKIEKTDVSQVLFDVIENIPNPNNIKFIIDTPMPLLMTNKITLTQVFMNLMTNAVKYHDKKEGTVSIGCVDFKDHYQFYVSDNGPGIAVEYHEKIFEIFQTLQPRDTIESTGMGLAIVRKIIENQNGEIWLKSHLGKGSIFYFTWPKVPRVK